jgi:hypothetical protein
MNVLYFDFFKKKKRDFDVILICKDYIYIEVRDISKLQIYLIKVVVE